MKVRRKTPDRGSSIVTVPVELNSHPAATVFSTFKQYRGHGILLCFPHHCGPLLSHTVFSPRSNAANRLTSCAGALVVAKNVGWAVAQLYDTVNPNVLGQSSV